ncbi:MAG: ATP-binding protein [Phycisphaerae bacterium]
MALESKPIGLRRKLAGLLAAFAAFAVLATAATIYGVHWQVEQALREFELTMGTDVQVRGLRVALKEQMLSLREVVEGSSEAVQPYFNSREELFSNLRQVAAFAAAESRSRWPGILQLAQRMTDESDRCLALAQDGRMERAQHLLATKLEGELLPALEATLKDAVADLDVARHRATRGLGATSSFVLVLTLVVAGVAACLVIVGVMLIRRWLIAPISELHEATEHFSRGELGFRVQQRNDDELGTLACALNEMARSLANTQAKLRASETKHRLLFENLRDAVVICDVDARIVEYHDSDMHLLGVEGAGHVGRKLLEVWPVFNATGGDWPAIIHSAVVEGRRYRAVDVELASSDPGVESAWVDFFVYRVEYGDAKYAAVVVRDVTERQRLQRKVRQAETMEAVGTLAGGLAHDFNNLLAGVIGSLSMLATEVANSEHAQRLRSVVSTCWQAAGLSRRLLNFAGSAHGDPQVFCMREAVNVILDSLDPSFLEGLEVRTALDHSALVRMDRDQFTQIVLNLVRNARDAMPEGGTIGIEVLQTVARDPDGGREERPYALLVVRDTGVGMTRDVQSRIFDPFFTTKSRASRRGRGMGMAIAYSAVRNAGGFIKVDSRPAEGTTFRIHVPVCEGVVDARAAAMRHSAPGGTKGTVLLVEEDSIVREVSGSAMTSWGYKVLAADGARDARDLLAAAGAGGIILAVIDMTLSDGDSLDLADHVLVMNSNARLILTTAVAELPLPARLAPYVVAQLGKPFDPDALASALSAAGTAIASQG